MNNQLSTLISARVTRNKAWTDSLFTLTVHSPNTKYKAGQFTKLAMFNNKGELIRRAYSFVNHPDSHLKSGELEFLIVADSNGSLSPLLHSLTPGDEVFIGRQGAGFMTLDEIPLDARDLWLISTGTAIGPFLSMLNDRKITYRFNHLVLGSVDLSRLFLPQFVGALYKAAPMQCSHLHKSGDNAVESANKRCPKGSSENTLSYVMSRLHRITMLLSSCLAQTAFRLNKICSRKINRP
ncbi:FAD-binding oxidoreductase [Vibrio sp. 99-8-1]|uniref:FAD-binding oxidoreductase n=1 Tax=Vibrio sp. 99-8-1 TaxID=2607602 RepID=UPI001C106585|nr:FAD-binding oxidoreductase [Vibrio sp. 99-8-1]